jgi:ribosome modulation factor
MVDGVRRARQRGYVVGLPVISRRSPLASLAARLRLAGDPRVVTEGLIAAKTLGGHRSAAADGSATTSVAIQRVY